MRDGRDGSPIRNVAAPIRRRELAAPTKVERGEQTAFYVQAFGLQGLAGLYLWAYAKHPHGRTGNA